MRLWPKMQLWQVRLQLAVQLLWLQTTVRLQQVPQGQPEPDTEYPTVSGLLGFAQLTANAICNMASGSPDCQRHLQYGLWYYAAEDDVERSDAGFRVLLCD